MSAQKAMVWLVADDSEDDFLLFRRAFHKVAPEAKLFWVRDGAEARKYLQGQDEYGDRISFPIPAVTLADVKMPVCSGLELLAWIRQQPELRALPVIVFSSSAQRSDINLAYELQANWYLTKPATLEELIQILSRLFEHARLDWAA